MEDPDLGGYKKNVEINLVMIQSKTANGFSEAALNSLTASTEDLFDLSIDLDSLASIYNKRLLEITKCFRETYKSLASKFPKLTLTYRYATKGIRVDPKVDRKVRRLEDVAKRLFSSSTVDFQFVGASELLSLARRSPVKSISLQLSENPISNPRGGFVCLVSLTSFFDFLTDDGVIRAYLFEPNVRDYQGKTSVNDEIQKSLSDPHREDFWWLNNGVTIVASDVTYTSKHLMIQDPEIVNGLQTSTELYRYFIEHSPAQDDGRNILVRVIKPDDGASLDRIIKATNSQTPIPPASLRATDKIQRDIEEYLAQYDLYYDRRKNYYKNNGKPVTKIISIPSMAQAILAIVLLQPNQSRARPSSLLKRDSEYSDIFDESTPIEAYYKSALIMLKVEEYLKSDQCVVDNADKTNLKFYLAMYAVLVSFDRSVIRDTKKRKDAIAEFEVGSLTDEHLVNSMSVVRKVYEKLGANDQVAKGKQFVEEIKKKLGIVPPARRFPVIRRKKSTADSSDAKSTSTSLSGSS